MLTESDAVRLAKRLATRIWKDPFAEGHAVIAALHALKTYNPDKGTTEEQWVLYVTKMEVRDAQRRIRRLRYIQASEEWWEYHQEAPPQEAEEDPEFLMLWENYMERKPAEVMAKKRDITTYAMRKLLHAAVQRFARRFHEHNT